MSDAHPTPEAAGPPPHRAPLASGAPGTPGTAGGGTPGGEVAALRAQLTDLQDAAADLVGADDADTVLARLRDRAAAAVLSTACVVVADARDGRPPVVHARGLAAVRVAALADALLAGEEPEAGAVVVEIASARRHHGWIAVLGTAAGRCPRDEHDRPLLQAYARHAAAGLDLLDALEDSRREAGRAHELLALAHGLATAPDAQAVATVVAEAVPAIVGSDGASLMLWDPARGALRTVATAGMTPEQAELLRGAEISADSIPEVVDLITRRRPLLLDADRVSRPLSALLGAVGARSLVVVPLVGDGALLGIVTASWRGRSAQPSAEDVLHRCTGVADHAATALQNARLLETVRHQALHDALTGLPNRVLFTSELEDGLRRVAPGHPTAVLFCDVDRFKTVNDQLGHAAGDELLRQVAARLRGELRPADVVGRLSGDEFAVRLADADEQTAVAVARRIVDALDQPFRIEGREVRITVSVGVAVHVGADGRGERLVAAADAAMYEAKERGRNQVAVAGAVPGARVVPSLEAELAGAVESGQLRLYYQPVLDVGSSGLDVVGAEALLRWAHPRLGLLGPAAFLPLAEESGLVSRLDLWAVRAACAALASWPQAVGTVPLRVAVNLASRTLLDPDLVPTVRTALAENGVSGDQLHLELVESRALADLPGVVERLVELRRLGVRISLDDFGTGYSTLTWLQSLPIDQIKIDRSFVKRLTTDVASAAVVRGVMALARELDIEVIAEGVEEQGQLAMLQDLGCSMAQGYLLGRPGPALELRVADGLGSAGR
ncbi:putative bifunctional diguanylate cyclase/phosphodiesterase [Actinotalea solisilvae]|uniref:putative bifunctional diguanylate cyclase/phosphodiesterase n=1 Tax=Actinotalea solisilvae TaxID=2072922 RepID=UPI0018F24572|nr:EAL domain-containing protein [Actinotalea solisilvae]